MKYYKILIISMLVLLTACRTETGRSVDSDLTDWHYFRGDAELSGYTNTRLPEKPVLMWTFKGNFRTVSSPVVDKGTTYWVDKRGLVCGVDFTGNKVFEYDMQTAVESTPMIYDSVLYIGRIDGKMVAISLASEDTVWTYETMGQVSAPPNCVNFEGRRAIVFGSYDNYLYCNNYKDGTKINSYESGYYINGAVAVHEKYILFGGCDAWLRIIDCKSGIPTDSLELEAYIPASPAVMGDYCYVGDYSGNVYEIVLEDGKIVRHRTILKSTSQNASFVSVPALTSETVYVLSDDRHLYAIKRRDGTINWKYLLKGNVGESSPVVCRDKVIVCTKTGVISILNAEQGALEWEYDTGEQIVASPAVIQGRFMILTAKGTLMCFGNI